jgi:hypothetical protein
MKPVFLFVGLSLIIIGAFICIFSYPNFIDLYDDKRRLENLGAASNPFLQALYQETVRQYNETLITLIGGIALLIVGLGATIYSATRKKVIPTQERLNVSIAS